MLVEALIAQICIGLQGQQLEACHKALQAASVQTGVAQNVGALEDSVQRYATHQATYVVRKVGIEEPVGAALYVVKIVRERRVEYRLIRNRGLVPEVRAGAALDSGALTLKWGF